MAAYWADRAAGSGPTIRNRSSTPLSAIHCVEAPAAGLLTSTYISAAFNLQSSIGTRMKALMIVCPVSALCLAQPGMPRLSGFSLHDSAVSSGTAICAPGLGVFSAGDTNISLEMQNAHRAQRKVRQHA